MPPGTSSMPLLAASRAPTIMAASVSTTISAMSFTVGFVPPLSLPRCSIVPILLVVPVLVVPVVPLFSSFFVGSLFAFRS